MREDTKKLARRRLAKLSGQIGGLQRMIEDGRGCVDVLTQVSAARSALNQFGVLLLCEHLEGCVYGEAETSAESGGWQTAEQRTEEIKKTLGRFMPVLASPVRTGDGD